MNLLGATTLKSQLKMRNWGHPPDLPSFVSPFHASLFHITDFCHEALILSNVSQHATEWGPSKVLPIGHRTCQGRPCLQFILVKS